MNSTSPLRRLLPLPLLLAALAFAPSARADIPPPDACGLAGGGIDDPSLAGTPCTNDDDAGPGVCTLSTCDHDGVLADGGLGTTTGPCYLCKATDAGAADAGPLAVKDSGPAEDAATPATDSGSPQPDAGSPTPDAGSHEVSDPAPASSGGCSLSPNHRDETVGASMLALGIVALAFGRRKKR